MDGQLWMELAEHERQMPGDGCAVRLVECVCPVHGGKRPCLKAIMLRDVEDTWHLSLKSFYIVTSIQKNKI